MSEFPSSSIIHRQPARVKLLLALAMVISLSLAPNGAWYAYLFYLALILSVELTSRVGLGFYHTRALMTLPFALAAAPLLLTGSPPYLDAGLPASWGLRISASGLERFLSIVFKSWGAVQVSLALAATTEVSELLAALRQIGIPRILVSIMGLMWRYLGLIRGEAQRLLQARESRSAATRLKGMRTGGSLFWRARVASGMAGSLFLRSLERSERVYAAMAARGYIGETLAAPVNALKPGEQRTLIGGMFLLWIFLMLSWLTGR
ncbi:MAG: cobalt ECF transporter T component CbiQ [Anaerolineaceae bacterium]|nr:cobalt ECF transporter T component CbiQ [Anaerolineaceae bacterium]